MKILIQTRSTLNRLNGGDKVQIESTAAALRDLGHEVTIANHFVRDLFAFDVVHLFNMQIEPHSFLIYMLQAKKFNKPVALSTIYWNPAVWKNHAETPTAVQAGRFGKKFKALFEYKFKGVPRTVFLAALLKSKMIQKWLLLALTQPASGRATVYIKRCLIQGVDIILPNGAAEAEQVERDFTKAKRWKFVPNGVSTEFKDSDPQPFVAKYGLTDFVLSVGRIESRKNVLALVRACRELNLQLVLIGNDSVEPQYTQAVKDIGSDNLLIIKELPHDQLGPAYAAAKVHALVSWFETPGLSSLEAAVAGCTIVTTAVGTTREYFSDLAYYCEPTDQTSINSALAQAVSAKKSSALSKHILGNFTWKHAAEATQAGYKEIGAGS